MEATAGILRGYIEFRRSSPVRWLLERVGVRADRLADAPEVRSAAQDRWQEIFWTDAPRRAETRGRRGWMEQPELWQTAPAATAGAQAPVATERAALARPRPRAAATARTLRMRPQAAAYADQRRSVRTEDIARYLQVNQAVHGATGGPAPMDLPRRAFAAEVELWKGRNVGTPFVSGC